MTNLILAKEAYDWTNRNIEAERMKQIGIIRTIIECGKREIVESLRRGSTIPFIDIEGFTFGVKEKYGDIFKQMVKESFIEFGYNVDFLPLELDGISHCRELLPVFARISWQGYSILTEFGDENGGASCVV